MSTVARITNDKKLELHDEVMEYPTELEGGRNLVVRHNEIANAYLAGNGSDPGTTAATYPNPNSAENSSTMTEAIPVIEGEKLTFSKSGRDHWRYNWLDENHKFISRNAPTGTITETAPNGSHFLWVSYPTNEQVKIERGNTATPWTPAPEDLGYDFPPEITSFKPGISSGGILLTPEIIEYPAELEGGRNLIIRSMEEINTWLPLGGQIASWQGHNTSDYIKVEYGAIYIFQKLGTSTEYFRTSHYDVNKNYMDRHTSRENMYRWEVPENVAFIRTSYIASAQVKLEKGNKATDWTPAPEDLGMDYPNDIQHFSTGFRSNGKILVRELIEGKNFRYSTDKKIYLNKLEEGVDLNG